MAESNKPVKLLFALDQHLFLCQSLGMKTEQFRIRLASFLKRNNIAPTLFGRTVLNDPAWVGRVLDGREPRERTRDTALKAMKNWPIS